MGDESRPPIIVRSCFFHQVSVSPEFIVPFPPIHHSLPPSPFPLPPSPFPLHRSSLIIHYSLQPVSDKISSCTEIDTVFNLPLTL
jgi:hypothetical protein